jgi:hypothetical protein
VTVATDVPELGEIKEELIERIQMGIYSRTHPPLEGKDACSRA